MELPIGISDFKKLVEYKNHYTNEPYLYVDKTPLIREIDADGTEVIIITRPRRFGKTLNMSMLQYFYAPEVNGEPTSHLFENLKIASDTRAMEKQGSHPVVFISFKGVDGPSFEDAQASLSNAIQFLFSQHEYLIESTKLSKHEKAKFEQLLTQSTPLSISDLQVSLQRLTTYLKKHFDKKVMVLIDEYDAPIQKSYSKNYYEQMIEVFKDMFGDLLKGNDALEKAVLTGILRVSKESLFSTLNNVEIYSILHDKYSPYFGFTEPEVETLFKAKGIDNIDQARQWYNGYQFGQSVVYNPWSIIKYLKESHELKSHWVNTSSNRLAENLILKSSPATKAKLESLMSRDTIKGLIDEHVVFNDLDKDESALWSLLLASGYLMATKKQAEGRYYRCELKIPNEEVLDFYCSTIKKWISSAAGITWFDDFVVALKSGDAKAIEKKIQEVIDHTMSYHDTAKNVLESFFHGLMLGIVVGLKEDYQIKSNRESGLGRYDVALLPKKEGLPGIIMEFKAQDVSDDKVESLAKEAVQQISQLDYPRELKENGVTLIKPLGIGFSKRKVCVINA